MMTTGHRISTRTVWIIGTVVVLLLAFGVGSLLTGRWASNDAGVESPGVAEIDMGVPSDLIAPDKVTTDETYSSAEEVRDGAASVENATAASRIAEPMVIRNASLEMRVDSVDSALGDVRAAAARHDAQLTDLYLYGGTEEPVRALPEGLDAQAPSPATATITLRVAADDLDALIADISKLGAVISQTASASDVTEQYIDLAARMKNLAAEEARLRSFFNEAKKVSELLAVETELSRVRGEIEALQAQIDYLERQVAQSTLTVMLSEPGPLVRPDSGDWGFAEAVTSGIQAAVKVLTTLITGIIALAPLLVLAGIVVVIVRMVRRKRHRSAPAIEPQGSAPGVPTAESTDEQR